MPRCPVCFGPMVKGKCNDRTWPRCVAMNTEVDRKRGQLKMPKPKKPQRKPKGAWIRRASLTLLNPGKWSTRDRAEIAAWLRDQARFLTRHGDEMTEGRYRAGFNVPAKSTKRAAPKRRTPPAAKRRRILRKGLAGWLK